MRDGKKGGQGDDDTYVFLVISVQVLHSGSVAGSTCMCAKDAEKNLNVPTDEPREYSYVQSPLQSREEGEKVRRSSSSSFNPRDRLPEEREGGEERRKRKSTTAEVSGSPFPLSLFPPQGSCQGKEKKSRKKHPKVFFG